VHKTLLAIPLLLAACECTTRAPNDASVDARIDATEDAFEPPPDAMRATPRRAWLNPTPPVCARAGRAPRWLVTADPGPVGTLRWVRSLREADFTNWTARLPAYRARDVGPSLSGTGLAFWTFSLDAPARGVLGLGLDASGRYATAGGPGGTLLPLMWLPEDVFFSLHGRFGLRPLPPDPAFEPDEPPAAVAIGMPDLFGDSGAHLSGGVRGEMPGFSVITGDFVTFAWRFGDPPEGPPGAGAGCAEGNRWFTELPLVFDHSTAWVRPDGDAIIGSLGDVWVLDGATGEVLRSASTVDSPIIFGKPAAYQPGCGVLIEAETATSWYWLNDDTMERGPELRLPADRPTGLDAWAGTPDCGLVATASVGRFVRLNADGRVRFDVPVVSGFDRLASPPVSLADGGTLLMTNPPGWVRFSDTGEQTSLVALDTGIVGARTESQSVLAPDGSMYFLTRTGSEYRFGAASTGAIPGPYLWPNSGLNWARTNSILAD
jgi:hypothetical protein